MGYICQLQIGYKMEAFARAGPLPPVEAHQGLRRGTFCSCRKYPNPKATPLKPYFSRPHFFCLAKRNGVGPPKKSAVPWSTANHSTAGAEVTRILPTPGAAAARRRKVRSTPFPPDGENYVRFLAPPFPTEPALLGFGGGPL